MFFALLDFATLLVLSGFLFPEIEISGDVSILSG